MKQLPDKLPHIAYMIFTLVALINYPIWAIGGYISDCWIGNDGGFCIPLWALLGVLLIGMVTANVFWFRERKKRTGKYW